MREKSISVGMETTLPLKSRDWDKRRDRHKASNRLNDPTYGTGPLDNIAGMINDEIAAQRDMGDLSDLLVGINDKKAGQMKTMKRRMTMKVTPENYGRIKALENRSRTKR